MIEKPIRDTPRWAGLWDTRDYFDAHHICFKFKTTLATLKMCQEKETIIHVRMC